MAISPADADKLSNEDLKLVTEMESFIDEYLIKNYNGNEITIKWPEHWRDISFKDRVIKEFRRRYEGVGWKTVLVAHRGRGVTLGKFVRRSSVWDD